MVSRWEVARDGVVIASGVNIEPGAAVNVRHFGAVGNGSDDTTAIDEAFGLARSRRLAVHFPAGTYGYAGNGFDHDMPRIIGDGKEVVTLHLAAGSHLISRAQQISALHLSGLSIHGGAGAIRLGHTEANVAGMMDVADCDFYNYSGTAIGHASSDFPYWKIRRCKFWSPDHEASTTAIHLPGLTDSSTITDCVFAGNRVNVRLGQGGNNTHLSGCEFLRFHPDASYPRVDVWVEPAPTGTNAGPGFTLRECKFGNENLADQDRRIVYADPDGDGWPALALGSTGHIVGHIVRDVAFIGHDGSAGVPLVFSTTDNVAASKYADIVQVGNMSAPALTFLSGQAVPASVSVSVLKP